MSRETKERYMRLTLFSSLHLDLTPVIEDTSINCMLITVVVLENISLLSVWLHLGTVCLLILTLVH